MIATVCALALAGCAGSRIDIAATSLSTISADTDQKVIEELLGSPIATEQASDLTVVAYHFNQGYHSSYHGPKGGIGGGAGANPAAVILLAVILGVAKVADYASAIADARESQRAQLAAIFDNNQKLVYATKLAKDEPDISARMKTIAARYASARAGDVEAQFALGKDALIPQQKIEMLKKAAANGDGKIKYEVAKLTTTEAEKIGLLREAAALEYAPALFDLGNAYYSGSGVPRDQTQAISWWRKAAANNHVDAFIQLGEAYRFGNGVPRDVNQAEGWFIKAANAGSKKAQRLHYAMLAYEDERGDAKLIVYANSGNSFFQYKLALDFLFGWDRPKDISKAAYWFERAAAGRDDDAAWMLGNIYAEGDAGGPNLTRAYMWYEISEKFASDNKDELIRRKNELAVEMTSEQIERAKRLANEWPESYEVQTFDEYLAGRMVNADAAADLALQQLDDKGLETSSVATAAQTANRPKLIIELVPEEDNRETKQLITKFREPLAAAVSQLGGYDVVYAGTEVASTPARRLVLILGIGAPDNTGPGISYGLANNFRITGALQDSQTGEALKRFTITKERPYDAANERLLIERSARQIVEAIS